MQQQNPQQNEKALQTPFPRANGLRVGNDWQHY